MMKESPYCETKDIDGAVPPGLVNELEQSVDAKAANQTSPAARFPATTDSMAWGGGRIMAFGSDSGLADGNTWKVDDSMDWSNRLVVVLACKFYDAAAKVPGGGSEPNDQETADEAVVHLLSFFTGNSNAIDDSPPSGGKYISMRDDVDVFGYLFIHGDAPRHLDLRNASAATVYPWLVLWVSDQFPTRT